MPKVSVVINCYNGERYLREAIESIFAQTYQDWEIIFWDNNSNDASSQIVKSFGDGKIKYFRSPTTTTLGEGRRNAVNVAEGEWVAFLDCDDTWYPDKLMVQMSALEGSDYVFGYAGILEVTAEGKPMRAVVPKYDSGYLVGQLLNQFDVNIVTAIIRRDYIVEHKINFDPEITASEEYNLFIRLSAHGRALVQKNILGRYRVYAGSLTDQKMSRWAIERRITLRQLAEEVPSIPEAHASAYKEAAMRGDYYEARYLMSIGCGNEAKEIMNRIGSKDWRYNLLAKSINMPGLWNFIHENKVRRKLLSIFRQ